MLENMVFEIHVSMLASVIAFELCLMSYSSLAKLYTAAVTDNVRELNA